MGTHISVMNKLTSILLWIGVIFLAESVYSRTVYIINDPYPDAYESQNSELQDTEYKRFNNNFYQIQDFAPKRFLKISKRRQSYYPDYSFDNDLISLDEPRPNPFSNQDQQNDIEDAPYHFRRSLRDNHNDRAAEDYYNEWIMSNIGK